jgi:hypothetical protein
VIRDREAPGSNPGPPTMSCLKTSWKVLGREGHLRERDTDPRAPWLVARGRVQIEFETSHEAHELA